MSYFNGTACFSPKVPSWIETVWSMNGGNVVSPRVLYPRFGETAGKASGVDWLFGLDEADPWVKTWRANSNVVFHASYVLQVVSKRVDQALVPMRNFIVGSADLQTRRLSPDDVSEPKQDELAIRPSPPAKTPGLSAPLDAQKLSGRVSPLRSPARDSSAEKAPYMRRSSRADAPTSIELANQSTLVDSLAPHDNSEQLKQDRTPVPFPQAPSVPTITTTAPLYQDCPRIDLVALVREKQKAKMLQRKKLSALPSPKEPQRRVILQDSSSKKTSYPDPNDRSSPRPRKRTDARARRPLALKERSVSVRPVSRIFSPSEGVSVFDGIGRNWVNDESKMNCFPSVL